MADDVKERMTQLGRRGGAATREKHGQSHFQKAGKLGGEKTKARGSEYFREIGRKGGQVALAKGLLTANGKKGGEAMKAKYGPEYYRKLGEETQRKVKEKRAQAQAIRAALEPFLPWLEDRTGVMKFALQEGQHYMIEQPAISAHAEGPSFGDCARLLNAIQGIGYGPLKSEPAAPAAGVLSNEDERGAA